MTTPPRRATTPESVVVVNSNKDQGFHRCYYIHHQNPTRKLRSSTQALLMLGPGDVMQASLPSPGSTVRAASVPIMHAVSCSSKLQATEVHLDSKGHPGTTALVASITARGCRD
jgi:hypothetical protein